MKSEFKQAVDRAIRQYKTTRLPFDPVAKKPEPLLTFKRGTLVHFAVSQYEVHMATRLEGENTFFLPFNKGTQDGGAGNDVPADVNRYATDYLWNEVLLPDNLLAILARYVHLQIEDKEDWEGRKSKKESMIFPRYHQWDVVNKLLDKAREEGPGNDIVMQQIENNSAEQALLGDFSKAIDDAIMDSNSAHQNQMIQLLSDPKKAASFARVVFDLLVSGKSNPAA
ncbi:MAG: hypothetical protein Q8N89_09825 [Azonexus sp.]|nr:hypothetical protein [Azonexus sp.]